MFHLSAMIAWHDAGWNGKCCQKPEENVYCESFDYIVKRKWRYLNGELNELPCSYEKNIFGFSPAGHFQSTAFGGWEFDKQEIENFIFPWLNSGNSLIFLFCRENPLSEDRIICGCIKPSEIITGWKNSERKISEWKKEFQPKIECDIQEENVVFLLPYQEIIESIEQIENIPEECIFSVLSRHKSIFKGMLSLIKVEEAISLLYQALDVLEHIKNYVNSLDAFNPDKFGRKISINTYIKRTQEELNRLASHKSKYPGMGALLWHLNASECFKKYYEAVFENKEEALVERIKARLSQGIVDEEIGVNEEIIANFNYLSKSLVLEYLLYYNLDGKQFKEVLKQFRPEEITYNPYLIFEEIRPPYKEDRCKIRPACQPISFELIDKGEKNRCKDKFDFLSPQRIRAMLIAGLKMAFEEDGHTALPEKSLFNEYLDKINFSLEPGLRCTPQEILNTTRNHRDFIEQKIEVEEEDEQCFYALKEIRNWEREIEKSICDRLNVKFKTNVSIEELKRNLRTPQRPISEQEYEKAIHDQAKAVKTVLENGLCIITGPAGSGKTTIIKEIIRHFENILVVAPTGKAAMRLREKTHFPAETIHRFLVRNNGWDFKYNELRPSPEKREFDLVIIDEASMVDVRLMWAFLESIKTNHLVLVGDKHQLPPVEGGRPFYDIVEYLEKRHPENLVSLKTILRTSSKEILSLAEFFLKGKPLKEGFIEFEGDGWKEKLKAKIKKLGGIEEILKDNLQLLTPYRLKGTINAWTINACIREKIHGQSARSRKFLDNDKVIQVVNDWKRELYPQDKGQGVFNGMMGIFERESESRKVNLYFPEGASFYPDLNQLEHAFCITVHKAQGSEWKKTMVIIPSGSQKLLTKQLLYTAVTRAEDKVILMVEKTLTKQWETRKLNPEVRYTRLLTTPCLKNIIKEEQSFSGGKTMMTWKEINEETKRCQALSSHEEVIDCLLQLLKRTEKENGKEDGWVAFSLGQEYEKAEELESALEYYQKAEKLFPLPEFKQKAREAKKRVERKIEERKEQKKNSGEVSVPNYEHILKCNAKDTLIIVCCTREKVWDYDPTAPDFVPAKYAYKGEKFIRFLKWAEDNKIEKKGFYWLILSGKYGFVEPWHPISRYDVNLNDPEKAYHPISDDTLKNQVKQKRYWRKDANNVSEIKLSDFRNIICINCSKTYLKKIEMSFPEARRIHTVEF